jgi:phage terminase large subunit-like protein
LPDPGPAWNANWLASRPPAERAKFLNSLGEAEAALYLHHWPYWARPSQLPPAGEWEVWLVLAGRGFGKTRAGAEWVRSEIESGRRKCLALVGATERDVRKVMVEGESGLLAVAPPWFAPRYEPSKAQLVWPNGARAHLYSAERPDRLRGPQHDGAWADELGAWSALDKTWSNLEMTLRAGDDPRRVVTTTPRPRPLLRDILADPGTAVARGSTFDNAAHLAPSFLKRLVRKYQGTRLGRQELMAEMLSEAEGALWQRAALEVLRRERAPEMKRVVVAIDPAVSAGEGAAETGIVVAGLGIDDDAYVLADLSGRYSPDGWARAAIGAYRRYGADRVIGEVNNGGDMIQATLRAVDGAVAYRAVRASRGKRARAEPVAALYEQGRVHHVGAFPALEDQLTGWEPGGDLPSPDRLDAAVWALTELMLGPANAEPRLRTLEG